MGIIKTNSNIEGNSKFFYGYSIIEILIVIGIFAVFSIIATQSVIITLRGSKKSESVVNVKEELDYASTVIERGLQSAKTITTPTLPCNASGLTEIRYKSRYQDVIGIFTCPGAGYMDPYIASSSAGKTYRLTSTKINFISCSFSCLTESGRTTVGFDVTGSARGISGVEGATYSASRRIYIQQSIRQ